MMTEQQKSLSKQEFFDKVNKGEISSLTSTKEFRGHKVGDTILLLNGFGCVIGPFEILGFDKNNKMFLNWDCYWYTVPVERIIKTYKHDN